MSRRAVIGSAVGTLAGGSWSLSFLSLAKVRRPRIEVIGREASQLVLLDTGQERVLIYSGPFDEQLSEGLVDLLGSLRQRIDILLATETNLVLGATTIRQRWTISQTMSLPELSPVGSPSANIAIRHPLTIGLANDVALTCIPHIRYQTSAIGTDPGWRIEIARGSQTLAIAANLDQLTSVPCGPFTLVITPTGSIDLAQRKSYTNAYALNDGQVDPKLINVMHSRIFERDVARFELGTDEMGLPGWTSGFIPES
ncbi:MAG: hypothetical protein WKF81_00655 [Thermomicrobiales bacterium]